MPLRVDPHEQSTFSLSHQLIAFLAIVASRILPNDAIGVEERPNGVREVKATRQVTSIALDLVPFEVREKSVVQ